MAVATNFGGRVILPLERKGKGEEGEKGKKTRQGSLRKVLFN